MATKKVPHSQVNNSENLEDASPNETEESAIPLAHPLMAHISSMTNQLASLGERWKKSHAYRYETFSTSPPHYEKCAYSIKTRRLHWYLEWGDWVNELTQLRDNLNLVLEQLDEADLPQAASTSLTNAIDNE